MRLLSLIAVTLVAFYFVGVFTPDAPDIAEPVALPSTQAPAVTEEETAEDVRLTVLEASPTTQEPPAPERLSATTPPRAAAPELPVRIATPTPVLPSLATGLDLSATERAATAALAPDPRDIRVVTGTRVNLRAGPSTRNAILTQVLSGDQVEILEAGQGGWVKISANNGDVEGWMAARFLTAARR
ncbi:SH3 domain-containing protein [Candidatus Rhodobacter oscarellae]|nr:SH3 domain-containing protein [Candidatus Rhodobacter lobularis]